MRTHGATKWLLWTILALVVWGLGATGRRPPAGAAESRAPQPGEKAAFQAIPDGLPIVDFSSALKEPEWQVLEGQFTGMDDCSDGVLKSLLGATDEQWRSIRPALAKLHAVREQTRSSIHMFIGVGGSYSGSSISSSASGPGASGSARGQAGATAGVRVGPGRPTGPRTNRVNLRVQHPAPQGANNPPGATASSSWGWWLPSQHKKKGEVTQGEVLCEQLLDLTADKTAKPEQLREKMRLLNEYRRQADERIRIAKEELREVVTRRQEAMLILMGDLD